MTGTGTPYDPDPDATRHERAPLRPPGWDATELERRPPAPPGSDATRLERPPPDNRGSDATQLEPPRSNPPGSDATHLDYTPPYPVNPPPPGYPSGPPSYGAPPYATQPGSPPTPPPYYPAGGYPQPAGPTPRRGRGLIAIVATLLVALVVVAGGVLIATRNRGDSNTAVGTQSAPTVAPSAIGATTAIATPATTPVTSPLSVPTTASTAPALNGPSDSWTDPENRVTVGFPTDWQKDTFDTRDENGTLETAQPLLQLTGPDRVRFSVTIYVSAKTLDEDVRAFRDAATSDPTIAFHVDQTTDEIIGGVPAKRLTGSYMQNGESVPVVVWFADHDGKRFGFSADRVGTHRNDVDAIVSTISFTPAGARVVATSAPATTVIPATRAPTALATTSSIFGTPATPRAATATRGP